MKIVIKISLLISLVIILVINSFSQSLSISGLTNYCSGKRFEYINQSLSQKGWVYFESRDTINDQLKYISWALNREYNSYNAESWIFVYFENDLSVHLSYSVPNQNSFTTLKNSLSSNGFNFIKNEFDANIVYANYENSNFYVQLITASLVNGNYSGSDTYFMVVVTKKSSYFDSQNGKKKEYYYGNLIQYEYNLKNGKLDGEFKEYYYNGKLKYSGFFKQGIKNGLFKDYYENGVLIKESNYYNDSLHGNYKTYYVNGNLASTGSYNNGKGNGLIREYNENGVLVAEVYLTNEVPNGSYKFFYDNGKLREAGSYKNGDYNGLVKKYDELGNISYEINYSEDLKHGLSTHYYYNNGNELNYKVIENYSKDVLNGKRKILYYANKKEELVTDISFVNGVEQGTFVKLENDTLIFGCYKDGSYNGSILFYFSNRFGSYVTSDTTDLVLVTKGVYSSGKKSGFWQFFNIIGQKYLDGYYLDDLKSGEWRYYFSDKFLKEELYLIENYKNDVLDGACETFYEEVTDTVDSVINIATSDGSFYPYKTSFYQNRFEKIHIKSNYKNNVLNGSFEITDSTGFTSIEGEYLDGFKNGKWINRVIEKDINGDSVIYVYNITFKKDLFDGYFEFTDAYNNVITSGYFTNDKKNGEWLNYNYHIVNYPTKFPLVSKESFKDGYLHGISSYYSKEGELIRKESYSHNVLDGSFITYNSLGKISEDKVFSNGSLKSVSVYNNDGSSVKTKYEIYNENNRSFNCKKFDYLSDGLQSQVYFVAKPFDTIPKYNFNDYFYNSLNSNKYAYPDGEYLKYNSQSKLITSGKMNIDGKIGVWLNYYYDQNLYKYSEYKHNELVSEKFFTLSGETFSGEFNLINNDINRKEVIKVKEGLRNGKSILYDNSSGKKLNVKKYKNGVFKE